MNDDFLSRWSQRKQAARRGERDSPAAPDASPENADQREARAAPALSAEELARLPKIEELTADSAITGFLRPGVPEALRNAALRRMWMLDPAIRDFVGHARDYAYDWNVPGGAPGHGPLEAGDHVLAMVRSIMGEPPEAAPSARPIPAGEAEHGSHDDPTQAAASGGIQPERNERSS